MGEEYSGSSAGEVAASPPVAGPRMRIDVLTVLPAMFVGPLDHSIIGRARTRGLLDLRVHDLRDWTHDRHRTTDDYAFGGGGGMVMKPEPLFEAVEDLLGVAPRSPEGDSPLPCPVVMMTPQGRRLDHAYAKELAGHDRLVFLAGHYEGFDERVRQHLATHELSLGDFVVTGGEIPVMLTIDAVVRLRPGVVGLSTATDTDSFAAGLLEHPQYTRPADFRGWTVPAELLSGHHAQVARWRAEQSLARTAERRPDLLAGRAGGQGS
jgi:tRNA (guanine37-N1)-methyltransferase